MLHWIVEKLIGTQNQRTLKKMWPLAHETNRWEEQYQRLSNEALIGKTKEFQERLKKGEPLDDLLPEAFAVVKNTCRRFATTQREIEVRGQTILWDMIPYDVQLIGGIVLHQGNIAEMATGEGKTLVATLPVYLNALTGKGTHVVTVNDYLAQRDSEWMGEIYRFLGLSVGCLIRDQSPQERQIQYQCDITYGTNSEFGFDYLRDNGMATSQEDQVQRGHAFAIIDEVDSILIDEARTPLIISGPATVSSHQYHQLKPLVEKLVREQTRECNQWVADAKEKFEANDLTEGGRFLIKTKLSMPRNKQLLKVIENPDYRRAMEDAELALYQDMRRTDLYQMKEEALFTIEEKSSEVDLSERGRKFLNPNDPEAFVLPDLVTAFHDINADASLEPEAKEKKRQTFQKSYDQASERIHNISQLLRAYSVFEKDVQYVIENNKVIIVDEFTGRPQPGRRWSDGLHQAIEAKEGVTIDRETQTLATITIQNYFRLYGKLSGMTGTAETEAHEFSDIYKLGVISIPTNKPIARLDDNDSIYKTRRIKYKAIVEEIKQVHEQGQPVLVGTISVESSELLSRMLKHENIPHQVLNAKFHQQEAEVVAQAGQRGAVTIATNMAGRGTDIKLGEGVANLGGLYVIGTERHESRRIDRQLRGRCARQGDSGRSKFFISFEDDLMRNFGDSRRIATMMTKMGMEDEEELQHPWLNKSVETAQKRVEQRNYQMRKHTLQYDDVMNQQREVIYTFRNDILTTDDPRAELFSIVEEVVTQQAQQRLVGNEADPESYITWLNTTFPLGAKKEDFNFNLEPEPLAQQAFEKIREAYDLKIKFEEEQAVRSLERLIILSTIDRLWQEHLYAMDGLRSSIHLRAIGQKDPLLEYKQEAFLMFESMMDQMNQEIVHGIFRSTSSITAFEQFLQALPQRLSQENPFETLPPTAPPATQDQAPTSPAKVNEKRPPLELALQRHAPKIGRNDPVPDGSGKKFKKVYHPGDTVLLPETYQDWRHSITTLSQTSLTPSFLEDRLQELQNPTNKNTKEFLKIYGPQYLHQVISWFQRAQKEKQ